MLSEIVCEGTNSTSNSIAILAAARGADNIIIINVPGRGFHVITPMSTPATSNTVVQELLIAPQVQAAFRLFEAQADRITAEQIEISAIAAPPFGEQRRAERFLGTIIDAGDESRRIVEAAQNGDHRMGEIAADSHPLLERFERRRPDCRRAYAELDLSTHPSANGIDLREV